MAQSLSSYYVLEILMSFFSLFVVVILACIMKYTDTTLESISPLAPAIYLTVYPVRMAK